MSKLQSWALAVLVTLLSACGGGDTATESTPSNHPLASAKASPQRAEAPLRAAHATFTFDRFTAWAEVTYPQLFNGQAVTGFQDGFQYRFYPSTGHYLALKGSDLYAMGPATSNEIMYLGTLGGLACFVYPGNCTGSADIPNTSVTTEVFNLYAGASSTIETQFDRDWFAVDLVAGVTYTFDLEGLSTGKGTLRDPYLALYDARPVSVASNDDVSYPNNLNSRITYKPTQSGRYLLEARSVSGGDPGTYQLTATMSGIANTPTTISGASNPAALVQAMGSRAYSAPMGDRTAFLQVNPTTSELVVSFCVTAGCDSRRTPVSSSGAATLLGGINMDTGTLSLSMVQYNLVFQPSAIEPDTRPRAGVDMCVSTALDFMCITPVRLEGSWVGTWSWNGTVKGCSFVDGGEFTMSVTESNSGAISGGGRAARVETRNLTDCRLASTDTLSTGIGGTATDGLRSNIGSGSNGTANLRVTIGAGTYLVTGQFDERNFNGTIIRETIGGSGTVTLTRQ